LGVWVFGCPGNFSITLGSQVDEGAFRGGEGLGDVGWEDPVQQHQHVRPGAR